MLATLSGMKKFITTILSALALTVLTACSAGEPKVAGTYELDTKGMVEAMMANMPKEQAAAAEKNTERLKAMKGTMTLNADGSCEMSITVPGPKGGEAREEKATGSWKLDGDKVSVTATKASLNGVEGRGRAKTLVGTRKGETLTFTDNLGPMNVAMPWKKK